ncbi:hypothetical protein ZPAH1_orf00368 [Aeromonas phage ZPAH1]|nr:hypothetical protein ZPAH1_orf00368 [Aeromonas phage ZPAH1]
MVTLEIFSRNANPGRVERTGDTHILYCFWEINDLKCKSTIGCNKGNFKSNLYKLVGRVTCSAMMKGADCVKPVFVNFPEGFNL